jgi:hypothetical protein
MELYSGNRDGAFPISGPERGSEILFPDDYPVRVIHFDPFLTWD